ncbi:uncharacterized protein K02A2.6-like [Cajanus cajan]|uniref:uncharacterized protein K02A2.6-like n=1 Tax=Cajanus cajan TaxID=3821 RepID=UPI00098DC7CB|nr:uncharacterized protein K02A2.6-like [Cajanus cajan]
MVVKSSTVSAHAQDLTEVFQALWHHQMRLNLEKCVFGVSGGKFLGFMLSSRGIEANPDKCQAILDMKSPSTLKEVQKLAGRLTSLSRFLPCLAEIARPILLLLKKVKRFIWTPKCEASFQQFKERLGAPPILSKPVVDLDMIVYLAVSSTSISAVLIQEKQDEQHLVYGLPHVIITDNGRQFIDRKFERFLQELDVQHHVTSVEHPQANGQAEAANKVLLHELKKRLGSAKGLWAEELPNIL